MLLSPSYLLILMYLMAMMYDITQMNVGLWIRFSIHQLGYFIGSYCLSKKNKIVINIIGFLLYLFIGGYWARNVFNKPSYYMEVMEINIGGFIILIGLVSLLYDIVKKYKIQKEN